MSKELILKSRIEAPDGAYYVYCLRVDVVRKNLAEVHVIAGDHHEFASQPLNSELSDFVSWLKNMEFNGKRDESRTYDLARYFEKHGKNHEWIEHLCGVLRVGDLSGLQYELSQDFEIALGHKDLIMQFDLSEYVAPPSTPGAGNAKQEDLSGLIPLSFVVSPFAGTPLIRLTPGDRVHVRFAKPKDGRSANYIKRMNVQAADGRYEVDAVLKSLGTRPGKGDVLLKFKLDGGAEGFVIEENQDIRVKMADTGGSGRGGRRGAARRETPDLVGGPLALVLLVIAFVSLFGLLYVFVF